MVARALRRQLEGTWRAVLFQFRMLAQRVRAQHILRRLAGKESIRVAFLVIHDDVWKLDDLFKAMLARPDFEPIVVICPVTTFGLEHMREVMRRATAAVSGKGFQTFPAADPSTGLSTSVIGILKPDVVFFTNPHSITSPDCSIAAFGGSLACYVPYGIMCANIQKMQYDLDFHGLLWRHYVETPTHAAMAQRYGRARGRNVVVTGYPQGDALHPPARARSDPWKKAQGTPRRIIWAPHHTIEDDREKLAYSTFLELHQFFMDLATTHQKDIQIAFKPHPMLRPKLEAHPNWGVDRTNAYFASWDKFENGQVVEGDYVDLFLASDALVHDSISFIAEYGYTLKPSLFLVRDETIPRKFNEFGVMALDAAYKARTPEEIATFINDVVLLGRDPKQGDRQRFFEQQLTPPNGRSATENILDDLVSSIRGRRHPNSKGI